MPGSRKSAPLFCARGGFLSAIYFYRIYETQSEIDLNRLEKVLPQGHAPARARFSRLRPKSILVDNPPLLINLEPLILDSENMGAAFTTQARIYDIGAISICLVYEYSPSGVHSFESLALRFAGQEGLDALFQSQLMRLSELLAPLTEPLNVDAEFYEDYTVYHIARPAEVDDPVALLMGEKSDFSDQIRELVLRDRLSYSRDDFVTLTWDTALICDPEDPGDLRDLIEFANVQLLELRYYDNLLSKQMEAMNDEIEKAGTGSSFSRLRRYRRIMSNLMHFITDITEISEKIDNLIKITEDVYYARVYQTILRVLRSDQWRASVNRKLQVIQQNYSLLSSEVNTEHSNVLEWIIIILISLEFGFALWDAFL